MTHYPAGRIFYSTPACVIFAVVFMRALRQYTALFMALFMGLSSTLPDFHDQLGKVASLIKHYRHHTVDEKQSIGFLSFLKMHYDENSEHRRQEHHEDLPLYNHCCDCHSYLVQECSGLCHVIKSKPIGLFASCHQALLNADKGSVFQPPRA